MFVIRKGKGSQPSDAQRDAGTSKMAQIGAIINVSLFLIVCGGIRGVYSICRLRRQAIKL